VAAGAWAGRRVAGVRGRGWRTQSGWLLLTVAPARPRHSPALQIVQRLHLRADLPPLLVRGHLPARRAARRHRDGVYAQCTGPQPPRGSARGQHAARARWLVETIMCNASDECCVRNVRGRRGVAELRRHARLVGGQKCLRISTRASRRLRDAHRGGAASCSWATSHSIARQWCRGAARQPAPVRARHATLLPRLAPRAPPHSSASPALAAAHGPRPA
jgi:hypothetical protein